MNPNNNGYGYPNNYPPAPPQKQGPSAGSIVLMVLGVLFLGGAGTCATCTCLAAKGVSDAKDKKDAEDRKAQSSATTVALDKFIGAYKANEVSADSQYKGTYVQLPGAAVLEIRKNIAGHAELWLNNSGASLEHPIVSCDLTKEGVAATLKKGSRVAVKGKVKGMIGTASFGTIFLDNCEIIGVAAER